MANKIRLAVVVRAVRRAKIARKVAFELSSANAELAEHDTR